MNKTNPETLDDLTGFLTRKAFREALAQLLHQSKAHPGEMPFSLALFDIDHFLKVNETYGHAGGDQVLVALAETVRTAVGAEVFCGRYGGDEFALLFPSVEREQAFLALEHIRLQAGQIKVETAKGQVAGIPISAGVAAFPLDGRTEAELLRKADHALYRAKASGRAQIRLAFDEKMTPKTTHYTQTQLERLSNLAEAHGVNEADLLREAMDDLLTKYGVNDIES